MANCVNPFNLFGFLFSSENKEDQKKITSFPASMEMETKTTSKKTAAITAEQIEKINQESTKFRNFVSRHDQIIEQYNKEISAWRDAPLSKTPNPKLDPNSNYYQYLAYITK